MITSIIQRARSIDWVMYSAALILCVLGMVTMASFSANEPYVHRQIVWVIIGSIVFLVSSQFDWRVLRRTSVAFGFFALMVLPLGALILIGEVTKGARSWFTLGSIGVEPIELAKLALIIVLAKYFSRRHIEIRNIRHILVSGLYAGVVFGLVALQPDFGGAIIIFSIWFGMILLSGISRVHLFSVFMLGAVVFSGLWAFGFQDYQKKRIMTFINPTADVRGAGYNVMQSQIAVGSGQILGKGIGYGTQSKLRFLPEYQTDFMFAAFAEEWGFVGVLIVFTLYGVVFVRIGRAALRGATNFETLFALGVLCYFFAHFALHSGINLGILPVTGTTIPFMSYGGSHLVAEFFALGIISAQLRYARATSRHEATREFSGGYDW